MKSKIKKMYLQDCFTVIALLSVLCAILFFVMIRIMDIVPTHIVKAIIISGGISAAAFAIVSAVAVLTHLKKNEEEAYLQGLTEINED